MIELKSYQWKDESGRHYSADFFPFIDGEPAHDINDCRHCIHDNGTGECEAAKTLPRGDNKLYLFCGSICGYFTIKESHD